MRQLATSIRCLITEKSHSQTLIWGPLIAHNNALIEPVYRGIKNPRKRSIRGDLNSGMWTVLRLTDSHYSRRPPIITRRSANELAMNKKLNRAFKDDFQEQNKMKCHFCPFNYVHFTLDDQVNSPKRQVVGSIHPYKFPKRTSLARFIINDHFWTLALEGNCEKRRKMHGFEKASSRRYVINL